jgi:hypothetical protein
MIFAQEVVVEAPPDPISIAVSVVAVAIAATSLLVTGRQGREIRNIETREHEWQAIDRRSAYIQVVPMSETYPTNSARGHGVRMWIRLSNTGRSEAREVRWQIDNPDSLMARVDGLEVLHPGEQFDLHTARSMADPPESEFTVSWVDDNGRQETTRLINL